MEKAKHENRSNHYGGDLASMRICSSSVVVASMITPEQKESILGDLRLSNAFFLAGYKDFGIQLLIIAQERMTG